MNFAAEYAKFVDTPDFSGLWQCTYWYPSNKALGDESSTYEMKACLDGTDLVLESIPNDEQSYMFVRLSIVDNVAMGNWQETTSPAGEFKGALYSGAGQLIVRPATLHMEGKWAGAGFDHKLKTMRIYSGNWEIKPIKNIHKDTA